MMRFAVVHAGTSSGVRYRDVVKVFKSLGAAKRYAEKQNQKPHREGFYSVEPKANPSKRKTLKRVGAALRKYVRGNPTKLYEVKIPKTAYDAGYSLTIRAQKKSSARAEARRYCSKQWAKHTGRPRSQYRLPRGTKVTEAR